MKAKLLALVAGLAIILSGCGLTGDGEVRLRANFLPTVLGFEGDDSGTITIAANSVEFVNPPGGATATIISYRVQVFDSKGVEYLGTEGDLFGGHLAINVPPGYVCAVADAAFCGLSDRIPTRAASEPQSFIMIAGPFAINIVENGLVRLNARITFTADWGGKVVSFIERVDITYPVAGE